MHKKTTRMLMRMIAAFAILTFVLLLSLNILDVATDVDLDALLELQRTNVAVGAFTTILGLLGPPSVIMLWIFMLYHWGTHRFGTPGQKKFWFAMLLLGNVAVAPIYYFVVFERAAAAKERGEKQGDGGTGAHEGEAPD